MREPAEKGDVMSTVAGALILAGRVPFSIFFGAVSRFGHLTNQQNLIALGASLIMFGSFAAAGDALRFTITGPLFNL